MSEPCIEITQVLINDLLANKTVLAGQQFEQEVLMFLQSIEIVGSSFLMAIQELWKNKLRTFLSLLGVTFGIFCIISVLATVNSLEQNIQNEVKALGTNTIYVDKWDYSGGPNYPWWKFVKRPSPKYEEMQGIKPRTPSAKFVAFKINE